jgi:hypothetical protein
LLSAETPPQSLLQAIFALSTPYRFGDGPITVETDPRWFATLPARTEGAAILELRRWPGDSVMSLYAIAPTEGAAAGAPPLPGADFERLDESDPVEDAWDGQLQTSSGPRPALWIERTIGEGLPRLGALLLPGDAGLGSAGVQSLTEEMIAVFRRVEIREAAWRVRQPVPPGTTLRLPDTVEVPGDVTEDDAPWQVVRGRGFTMGLPPGFRARRMDGGVPPPRPLDDGLLWFRGRTVDTDGQRVAVGDADRFGYVARVELSAEWTKGTLAPLGLRRREVERVAAEGYPLAAERTEALTAVAERWREAGFAGEWLVFRLKFDDHGYEIALPVLEGGTSVTLYWIPATWRDDSRAPAPPPVDPAQRFGIKFERLTRGDRQKQPWVEGYLTTPGLRAEVSVGISPAASLRSSNGYPIRFTTDDGLDVGSLVRLDRAEVEGSAELLDGLTELEKPGRYRASRVLRDEDGSYLFVAPDGHGFLFDFAQASEEKDKADERRLAELWDLMMRSVRLRGSEATRKDR